MAWKQLSQWRIRWRSNRHAEISGKGLDLSGEGESRYGECRWGSCEPSLNHQRCNLRVCITQSLDTVVNRHPFLRRLQKNGVHQIPPQARTNYTHWIRRGNDLRPGINQARGHRRRCKKDRGIYCNKSPDSIQRHPRKALVVQHESSTIDLLPMHEISNPKKHRNHSRKSEKFPNLLPRKLQGNRIVSLVKIDTSKQTCQNRTNIRTRTKPKRPYT